MILHKESYQVQSSTSGDNWTGTDYCEYPSLSLADSVFLAFKKKFPKFEYRIIKTTTIIEEVKNGSKNFT